jgi:hypothetical protein
MAPHWKCGSGQPVAGSNPALSAKTSGQWARGPRPRTSSSTSESERQLDDDVARSTLGDRTVEASLLDCAGRARRGTSGALNLQSAPAGLNSHPRTASLQAAASSDVEDRVPRSDEPRTVSGPEGSSTKRSSSGAAERPGPSRSSWRARGATGRRWVHGTFPTRGHGRPHMATAAAAATLTGAL